MSFVKWCGRQWELDGLVIFLGASGPPRVPDPGLCPGRDCVGPRGWAPSITRRCFYWARRRVKAASGVTA